MTTEATYEPTPVELVGLWGTPEEKTALLADIIAECPGHKVSDREAMWNIIGALISKGKHSDFGHQLMAGGNC